MAASGEPSVEPLSTTMTSPSIPDLHSASFASFTTSATLAISLRQGRTTETFSVTAVRLSVGTLPKPVSVKLFDRAPHRAAYRGGRTVGCADDALFRVIGDHVAGGVGVDPALATESPDGRVR